MYMAQPPLPMHAAQMYPPQQSLMPSQGSQPFVPPISPAAWLAAGQPEAGPKADGAPAGQHPPSGATQPEEGKRHTHMVALEQVPGEEGLTNLEADEVEINIETFLQMRGFDTPKVQATYKGKGRLILGCSDAVKEQLLEEGEVEIYDADGDGSKPPVTYTVFECDDMGNRLDATNDRQRASEERAAEREARRCAREHEDACTFVMWHTLPAYMLTATDAAKGAAADYVRTKVWEATGSPKSPRVIFTLSRRLRRPTLKLMTFSTLSSPGQDAINRINFESIRYLAYNGNPHHPILTNISASVRASISAESCCLAKGGCRERDVSGCLARLHFIRSYPGRAPSTEHADRLARKQEMKDERERGAAIEAKRIAGARPRRSPTVCNLWKNGKCFSFGEMADYSSLGHTYACPKTHGTPKESAEKTCGSLNSDKITCPFAPDGTCPYGGHMEGQEA